MEKITFKDLPSTDTPINSTNLNLIQTNTENAINEVQTDVDILLEETNNINSSFSSLKTNAVAVTTTTIETTIASQTISDKGYYLLTGTIPINFYGIQTGREIYLRVKVDEEEVFASVFIINSEVYTCSQCICCIFETTSTSSNLKVTIQNNREGSEKQWACNEGTIQIIKLR